MLNKVTLLGLIPEITGFEGTDRHYGGSWYCKYNFDVEEHERYHVIFGWYELVDYDGQTYVFGYDWEEEKFFEIAAYHCSCYGLQQKWDPEYFDTVELLSAYLAKFKDQPADNGQQTLIEFLKKNNIEV